MNERERQLDKRQLEPLFPCASIRTVLGVFFFKVTSGVYTFVCVNPVSDHFFEGCVLGFSNRQMLFSRFWVLTTF